ncbi:34195_t:CDS:2 [Gigaspora margarita]|uniref:34195_t:CDS:1 n=1 Tax=Gigaspora margarita TaxID=4874 RepID=A0ABN7V3W9_GIGMA|nr:34195_t:CDS:2 [Gigaspora margarita]
MNSKCDIFGGDCKIKAQQLLELNHQYDHQHTLYPGTGPKVKQQIQEIAADYFCQLCHPVARNITIQFISF